MWNTLSAGACPACGGPRDEKYKTDKNGVEHWRCSKCHYSKRKIREYTAQEQQDLIEQSLVDIRAFMVEHRNASHDYYGVFLPIVRELKEAGVDRRSIGKLSDRVIESCVSRNGRKDSNKGRAKVGNLVDLIKDAWDDAVAKNFARELKPEDVPLSERPGQDVPINVQISSAGVAIDIAVMLETALMKIKGTVTPQKYPGLTDAENRRQQKGEGHRMLRNIWDQLSEQERRACEQFYIPPKKRK